MALVGWLFSGVFAAIAATWGAMDDWLKALFLLTLLDTAAGTMAAAYNRTWCYDTFVRGASRKAMMAVLVTASVVLQVYIANNLGYSVPVTVTVAGFYVSIQFLSILKNAYSMGMPIPRVLLDMGKKIEDLTGGPGGTPASEGRASG